MFANALLVGAFAAFASAQSAVLTFTHVPNPVTDGQAQAITYATNDTVTPVTILLRHGSAANLQTLETLTTDASNGQFIWTPCAALPNGDDYALEIRQGTQVNYFGPFAVQGASASGTCSGISSSASATSSGSSGSATASSGAAITSGSSPTLNSTTSAPISMGTGTAMARNTTMSSATLSKTSTATITSSLTTTAVKTSATSHSASATPTGGASEVGSSAIALVLGAVAAVILG